MAYSTEKNQVFMERLKNAAVAKKLQDGPLAERFRHDRTSVVVCAVGSPHP